MSDIGTMMWKESRDLLFRDRWMGLILPVILIGALGVVLPLAFGLQWLELTAAKLLFVVLYVPFIISISIIGDAIAGERERHTLETLLASRMPDRAILLGKVIVTVAFAWGIDIVSLLLGWVVVNVSNGQGNWLFYQPFDLFLEGLALSLMFSLLIASAGVLISLHVATARQAQQALVIGTLVVGFVVFLALRALPADALSSLGYSQLMLIIIAVIAILDAILLGLARVSFQRSRLILS
jgi:ABC-2 type transport system permease protein